MKTLIQKVHVEDQHSFACREYRTPNFETNWHKHEEYELILITKGNGTLLMGDYIGEYKNGDVYFLAGNLPHWFRKQQQKMNAAAIVIHFRMEIFGLPFLATPELKTIHNLLRKNNGIQLQKHLKKNITDLINGFQHSKGFYRIQQLLFCLYQISCSNLYSVLTSNFSNTKEQINPAIEIIFNYSFKHYLNRITLSEIAKVANMSIPTFCRFFKRNVKKTYFDFLQELRIGYACQLLTTTKKPILEICYESGYNSWAHFSKKFKAIKHTTASRYRNELSIEF